MSFTTGCRQFSGNLPVAPPISPTSNPATTKPHQCTTAEFNCFNQGSGACIPSTQVILRIETSLLWTSDSVRNCLFFLNFYFKFYALEFFLVRVASVAVEFCQNSLFNPHLARSLLLVTRYSICITYRVIIGFCSCQELPGFVRVHPRQSLLPTSRLFFFLLYCYTTGV